jgi:hypothetical protein
MEFSDDGDAHGSFVEMRRHGNATRNAALKN